MQVAEEVVLFSVLAGKFGVCSLVIDDEDRPLVVKASEIKEDSGEATDIVVVKEYIEKYNGDEANTVNICWIIGCVIDLPSNQNANYSASSSQ
jgi:hypothetical protein